MPNKRTRTLIRYNRVSCRGRTADGRRPTFIMGVSNGILLYDDDVEEDIRGRAASYCGLGFYHYHCQSHLGWYHFLLSIVKVFVWKTKIKKNGAACKSQNILFFGVLKVFYILKVVLKVVQRAKVCGIDDSSTSNIYGQAIFTAALLFTT